METVIEHLRKVCEHWEKGICTDSEFAMEVAMITDDAFDVLEVKRTANRAQLMAAKIMQGE